MDKIISQPGSLYMAKLTILITGLLFSGIPMLAQTTKVPSTMPGMEKPAVLI